MCPIVVGPQSPIPKFHILMQRFNLSQDIIQFLAVTPKKQDKFCVTKRFEACDSRSGQFFGTELLKIYLIYRIVLVFENFKKIAKLSLGPCDLGKK